VVEKFEPQVVRNVISKETCQTFWMFWKEWYLKVPEEMRMLKDTGWLERQVLRKLMLKECM